jgi:acyl-coenzyme A synthetase/AMP-(fatty) acid ligase
MRPRRRSGEWFRTGDLFRQDARGYYYIVGRMKDDSPRRRNISSREVEAVLREIPEIVEAAAVPVADATRGEEVKVFVVLRSGVSREDVPPPRIVSHCEASLARFKVPRYIAYVDHLPKTPSEKIAKHLLAWRALRRGRDVRPRRRDAGCHDEEAAWHVASMFNRRRIKR